MTRCIVGAALALGVGVLAPASAHATWVPERSWDVEGGLDLAVGPTGVHVAYDQGFDTRGVRRYSLAGKQQAAFSTQRPGSSIALTRAGNLLLSDFNVPALELSRSGQQVAERTVLVPDPAYPEGAPSPEEEARASDIDVDSRDDVYVSYFAGEGQIGVVRYDAAWQRLAMWGREGSAPGEFGAVPRIASDGRGHVYASDAINDRIQLFTSDGRFVHTWGQLGAGRGQFTTLGALGVDRLGNLWVGDSQPLPGTRGARLQRFTPAGKPIAQLFLPKSDANAIVGIEFDRRGRMYVLTGGKQADGHLHVYLDGGPALTTTRLRATRGRVRVPLRCEETKACRGSVTVRAGKRTVARGSYRIAAGRTARVTLRLRRSARGKVTVVTAPRGGLGRSRQNARLR